MTDDPRVGPAVNAYLADLQRQHDENHGDASDIGAAMRAALAAADKAAWRPISEAPKDGTPVLTKVEDETGSYEPAVARWFSLDLLCGNPTVDYLPEWRDGVWLTADPEDFDSDQALAEYICSGDYQPTHFMWLPR